MKSINSIIIEQVHSISPRDIQILEQETEAVTGVNKVVFRARLQTAEEKNQNQRYYKKDICEEIVKLLRPKALSRSLFQEVDHPLVIPSSGDDSSALKKRAITVEIKNSGSLIRDIYMVKNDIIGEIETLSGFRGPDIYNLVINDKANIGFSLRMFARVINDPRQNMLMVERPLRPITYDIVSNPSHQTATILEFLPEDVSLDNSNLNYLSESDEYFLNQDHISIGQTNDTKLFVKSLIEESYNNQRFIRFKF